MLELMKRIIKRVAGIQDQVFIGACKVIRGGILVIPHLAALHRIGVGLSLIHIS